MEFAREALPEELANPDDAEFNGPDMTSFTDVRRRGVAPSLVSAQEKWHGMFKRNSPLVAWKVGFRTFRRAHSGDTSFPEGFPDLQTFFDKCQNVEVFEWIVGVYKGLVNEAVAEGLYGEGESTELDVLRNHILLWAGRHKNWSLMVRNPDFRNPESVQPKKKRGMFDPKPPKLTDEQRADANRLRDEAAAKVVPKMIPKTFMLTRMQKGMISMLVRKFKDDLFPPTAGPYPAPVRIPLGWAKVFRVASSLGKMCLYLRAKCSEIEGKKSSASSTLASTPGSPSLAKRVREEPVGQTDECGSPSLKRVCE